MKNDILEIDIGCLFNVCLIAMLLSACLMYYSPVVYFQGSLIDLVLRHFNDLLFIWLMYLYSRGLLLLFFPST